MILIGDAPERERLFALWAEGQDEWHLRRDVVRVDCERASDVPDDLPASTVILGAGAPQALQTVLDADPWKASQQAMELWPDGTERLRQLRLHHLGRGWPVRQAPQRADDAAQVLGYLLRVHA